MTSPLTHAPAAQECDPTTLVPEIATPIAGDDFVLVVESVPGAIIRVFGKANEELGNGTGSVIALTRGLNEGETVIVTESLPTCLPTRGFSVVTQP